MKCYYEGKGFCVITDDVKNVTMRESVLHENKEKVTLLLRANREQRALQNHE